MDEKEILVKNLDFKAWYPSFKSIESGNIVRKTLEKGPANIQVDDLEVSRFLKVVLTEEEIEEEELEDLLHKVKDGEDRPKLTDQEIT